MCSYKVEVYIHVQETKTEEPTLQKLITLIQNALKIYQTQDSSYQLEDFISSNCIVIQIQLYHLRQASVSIFGTSVSIFGTKSRSIFGTTPRSIFGTTFRSIFGTGVPKMDTDPRRTFSTCFDSYSFDMMCK